jgi:hypothetical protein
MKILIAKYFHFSKHFILFVSLLLSLGAFCQPWQKVKETVGVSREEYDWYGYSVSVSGKYAIVGSMGDDGMPFAGDTHYDAGGSVYFLEKQGSNWNQIQNITPFDLDTSKQFGHSVAIDSNLAIVGAPWDSFDPSGGPSGAMFGGSAYIYRRNLSGVWTLMQKITPSIQGNAYNFGFSVSISKSGYALVANTVGNVFVFKNVSNVWSQTQILSNLLTTSIDMDDSLAIVGVSTQSTDSVGAFAMTNAGAAYVYQLIGTNWVQKDKLSAYDRSANDNFGVAVAIDKSGYAVVGSFAEDEDELGTNTISGAGSAYIFKRNGNGTFDQIQKLVAFDRMNGAQFGASVSIDNTTCVISSPYNTKDDNGIIAPISGSIYMFDKTSNNNFVFTQKKSGLASGGPNLVTDISERTIVVGDLANSYDENGLNPLQDAGKAYVFEKCYFQNNLSANICYGDSIMIGNSYKKTSGIYSSHYASMIGCDSIITVNLTVNSVDTSVTVNQLTLTANETGALYQCLDCNNNYSTLVGYNNPTFTVTTNGNFAVEIKKNGCTDTSLCYNISTVGLIQKHDFKNIKVSPNPTEGIVNIDLGISYKNIHVIVYDVFGKIIVSKTFTNTTAFGFELDSASGFYNLEISIDNSPPNYLKLIKE